MKAMARPEFEGIPVVDFYGDTTRWPLAEFVHSEKLAERSAPHDWTIRPHRHDGLLQLFLILDGGGRSRLDSDWHDADAPCIVIIPERAVHEFEWEEGTDGYALSIRSGLVAELVRRIEPLASIFDDAAVIDIGDAVGFLREVFAAIHNESVSSDRYRDVALDSAISLLAVWLGRRVNTESVTGSADGRAARHFARFARLVEQHHRSHWSVARYAGRIGITPSHLNAVCRRVSGKAALEVIHARLVLAARRQLTYTMRDIASVADELGFADPSYFTRFFKRETGMTPGDFRRHEGYFRADDGSRSA